MDLSFFHWDNLLTFFLLVGFELILGIDNILVISLIVAPLVPSARQQARRIGLLLALLLRLLFVVGAFYVVQMKSPLIFHFSARDLALILGGFFLIGKTANELYCMVEHKEKSPSITALTQNLASVVIQIVILDLIFSIDSVITAIGLTSHLLIIITAVIFSFIALLFYIGPVGEFILRYRSLKMIALLFLILLGASFVAEGLGYCIDKTTLYGIVSFSLTIEILQERYKKNHS
ncbi:MAG: TerC family protein [Verrucomicrobiae bacterium]|nr:TerC family protein [Verrucomicrobiae bacterium]